jgi:hypothetical protein
MRHTTHPRPDVSLSEYFPTLERADRSDRDEEQQTLIADGGEDACADCGVGNRGAFLVEIDGRTLCEGCAAPQPCERCGRPTDDTTLSGTFRCAECSEAQTSGSRPADQEGLDTFATDGGVDGGPAEIGDVVNMDLESSDERRYLVLFDEDYEDVLLDADNSVALLLDCNQAVEVLRLSSEIVGDLAPAHTPDKEPIEAMIDELQEVSDGAK